MPQNPFSTFLIITSEFWSINHCKHILLVEVLISNIYSLWSSSFIIKTARNRLVCLKSSLHNKLKKEKMRTQSLTDLLTFAYLPTFIIGCFLRTGRVWGRNANDGNCKLGSKTLISFLSQYKATLGVPFAFSEHIFFNTRGGNDATLCLV